MPKKKEREKQMADPVYVSLEDQKFFPEDLQEHNESSGELSKSAFLCGEIVKTMRGGGGVPDVSAEGTLRALNSGLQALQAQKEEANQPLSLDSPFLDILKKVETEGKALVQEEKGDSKKTFAVAGRDVFHTIGGNPRSLLGEAAGVMLQDIIKTPVNKTGFPVATVETSAVLSSGLEGLLNLADQTKNLTPALGVVVSGSNADEKTKIVATLRVSHVLDALAGCDTEDAVQKALDRTLGDVLGLPSSSDKTQLPVKVGPWCSLGSAVAALAQHGAEDFFVVDKDGSPVAYFGADQLIAEILAAHDRPQYYHMR
jgi:hypothetical protein